MQFAESHMWNHVFSPAKTVTYIQSNCVYKKNFSLYSGSHLQFDVYISSVQRLRIFSTLNPKWYSLWIF